MNIEPAGVISTKISTDPAFQWVREDWVDFILSKINPMLTLKRTVAKVKYVKEIDNQMVELCVTPNKNFKGFKPGQYVMVSVYIDGRYQQRCYSVVSFHQGELKLGIKKQGLVSNKIASDIKSGAILEIGHAQGEFVIKDLQAPSLFIASGSGITPIIPMLEQKLKASTAPTTLIYYSREHAYSSIIKQYEANYAHFKAVLVNTSQAHEHFDKSHLSQYCNDYAKRQTYVCGVLPMIHTIKEVWKSENIADSLHTESFVADVPDSKDAVSMSVTFTKSNQQLDIKGNLLLGAEAAGLKPTFGCRMGVCNSCVCTKSSGTVRNQVTGELDHQPNTQVRLCISEPVTPVVLDA